MKKKNSHPQHRQIDKPFTFSKSKPSPQVRSAIQKSLPQKHDNHSRQTLYSAKLQPLGKHATPQNGHSTFFRREKQMNKSKHSPQVRSAIQKSLPQKHDNHSPAPNFQPLHKTDIQHFSEEKSK
ncbi:hypothetical protein CDAR_277411 [Caerostris darwini]|uniref:Uncharacterized protein n=1 Tax=Caerostris darwini TaxID=1538125 RepID=A0AAV4VS18_9ARAC|nr:hypothetical protein CDAR_277411 [Caerostris darwini]